MHTDSVKTWYTKVRVDTLRPPLPSSAPIGVRFGAFSAWAGTTLKPNSDLFTLSLGNVQPSALIARLAASKAKRQGMLVHFAGGDRAASSTLGVFDRTKYDALVRSFAPLSSEIEKAVADGTIFAAMVMDEPFNRGGPGNEANGWGGVMTKARVDSLCTLHKQLWPNIATGVTHDWDDFEPGKSYRVCDFIVSQYRLAKGPVQAFRDSSLALGRRDGHAVAFSLNIMDGGTPAPGGKTGPWLCGPATGGRGTYTPNCRMTPEQVRDLGYLLGSAGCALLMWRYEASMMSVPTYQAAFKAVADSLGKLPSRSCHR